MSILNAKAKLKSDTLETLIIELQDDCQAVTRLVEQFMNLESTNHQKGDILAELLVAVIHLQSHCDEDLQNLIADEMESLVDDI